MALSRAQGDVLIPSGAEWHYRIGTQEASTPTDAWRQVQFRDQDWSVGAAPIGYGEADIVTSIPSSSAAVG